MGVNNRARRAAKRRKRSGGRGGGRQGGAPFSPYAGNDAAADDNFVAAALVTQAVNECAVDPRTAGEQAALLLGSRLAPGLVAGTVGHLLTTLVVTVVRSGWSPGDLAEITRRRLSGDHIPALAALLTTERDRHPADRVAEAWDADLERLGPLEAGNLRTPTGLEQALGLAGVFALLPAVTVLIPPPGTRATWHGTVGGMPDDRQLARVRALLAKAESTEFEEEADALSAKAQELISRYALERLVDEAKSVSGPVPVTARRLWIDPPYVFPKGMLINAVASANRCESVVAEELGFSTVIGEWRDLDAVELLATSLLVQANIAMLRHGRLTDRGGTSRTTSFRRSFLIAYATRIGERLRTATEGAGEQAGRAGELVPVLARRAQQVTAARDEMFPRLHQRETSISNGHGWAAGRAAADLALVDSRGEVTSEAG